VEIKLRRFDASLRKDFFDLHGAPGTPAECFCAFWWLPEGGDWSKRTADENREQREQLLDHGEYDGYIAYSGGKPVGWCQVGRRDRLPYLKKRMELEPSPEVWGITCFFILPDFRKKGVATEMLRAVLADLRSKGVRRVEAYPRREAKHDDESLWNGPEQIFTREGFKVVREDARRPVLALDLGGRSART